MDYTVERYKPYNNYVTDSDGNGHMERAVRIRVIAPIEWETVVSLPVDDFTVSAVKTEAKTRLQMHLALLALDTPEETFSVTI